MDERFLRDYAIIDVEERAPKPTKAIKSNSSPLLQCHRILSTLLLQKADS